MCQRENPSGRLLRRLGLRLIPTPIGVGPLEFLVDLCEIPRGPARRSITAEFASYVAA